MEMDSSSEHQREGEKVDEEECHQSNVSAPPPPSLNDPLARSIRTSTADEEARKD